MVLWAVLGGTLGLAQLISHERKSVDIELENVPTKLGSVLVRLPESWTQWNGWSPAEGQLQVIDPYQTCVLTVFIDRPTQPADGDPDAQIDVENTKRPGSLQPLEFAGLHKTGAITQVRSAQWFPDSSTADNLILAVVILPSGQPLYIQLNKRGVSQADRAIVEAVANGITPARLSGPRTRPAPKELLETD